MQPNRSVSQCACCWRTCQTQIQSSKFRLICFHSVVKRRIFISTFRGITKIACAINILTNKPRSVASGIIFRRIRIALINNNEFGLYIIFFCKQACADTDRICLSNTGNSEGASSRIVIELFADIIIQSNISNFILCRNKIANKFTVHANL